MSISGGVPFSFFCSLIREVSKLRPLPSQSRVDRSKHLSYPALQVFRRWVEELRRQFEPLPPDTTAICFRLLFPEDDVRRKYDIQETRMTKLLADCFGVDINIFEKWSLEESTGCLGQELKTVLARTCPHEDGFLSALTIHQVDQLLDELAAKSGYSHSSIRSKYSKQQSRPRDAIFRQLFRQLSPEDASVLTQIVLKDLRPLLYPLSDFHYTTALTKFNVSSVTMLTKEHAMDIWDPSRAFLRFYRVCADLDTAGAFSDLPPSSRPRHIAPSIGKPVAIPKSEKARGCEHALSFLSGSKTVWAETKYDGERAQIHVLVKTDGSSAITIFSKSKRDSTLDRHAVLGVIRTALGLEGSKETSRKRKVQQNVILDAEMVAFRGNTVDEFWRIRQLIEDTAYGVRGRRKKRAASPISDTEQESMNSIANEGLSLGLVFFDILYLDSESLLSESYAVRRGLLESLIEVSPGKALLAERYPLDMSTKEPCKSLYKVFAEHIGSSQEGLVIKAEDSRYNDYRKPWVKIKRDYLPDAGDKLDLVLLGASWEKIRGRSLRVPPTTFTTFYLGAVDAAAKGVQKFFAYFTASYGLTRDQLEKLNFFIKSSDYDEANLPFPVEIFTGLKPPPAVVLRLPLLVSVYGAGFTKAPQCKHYELRFPRITKYYLPHERSSKEGQTLQDVHKIALESVGRDRSDKDISDWANMTWGKLASPKIDCARKRKSKADYWEQKLAQLDGKSVLYDTAATPTRRKRSENDVPCDTRMCVRRKTDSQPLSTTTNLTILKTPPSNRPWDTVSGNALVWFAHSARRQYQPCPSITSWKEQISRERRLHSLDSLLMGCATPGREGVIIIDECGDSEEKWTARIRERAAKLGSSVVVYGCRTDRVLFKAGLK